MTMMVVSGCVSKKANLLPESVVPTERIDAVLSIQPTETLSHLKDKVNVNEITTMLLAVMKNSGGFKRVELGGDSYDYSITGTVTNLTAIFSNEISLNIIVKDKSSNKTIYEAKYTGIRITQSSSIVQISEKITAKLGIIRSAINNDLKQKSILYAKEVEEKKLALERVKRIEREQDSYKSDANVIQNSVAQPAGPTNYGRYYAIVIGNNNYQFLPSLKTAHQDAIEIAKILEKDYGFNVKLLLDAKRADIITILSGYREKLGKQDNLLIYYAGHGWLDKDGDEGYWLPVDATRNDELNWVSNSSITTTMKAMEAKHILIVADSCYSGKLARGLHIVQKAPDYYSRISQKRARSVLASGGLEPVIDSGGKGNHSVFASAFIDVLSTNQGIIDGNELFTKIRRPIMLNADQTPEYADIRKAGHDGGDFIFVRKR
jgi:hypothetical protein